jgi:hypothetical protein
MGHTYSGYTMGTSSEESVAMEKEIQDLQAQLKVRFIQKNLPVYLVSRFL